MLNTLRYFSSVSLLTGSMLFFTNMPSYAANNAFAPNKTGIESRVKNGANILTVKNQTPFLISIGALDRKDVVEHIVEKKIPQSLHNIQPTKDATQSYIKGLQVCYVGTQLNIQSPSFKKPVVLEFTGQTSYRNTYFSKDYLPENQVLASKFNTIVVSANFSDERREISGMPSTYTYPNATWTIVIKAE